MPPVAGRAKKQGRMVCRTYMSGLRRGPDRPAGEVRRPRARFLRAPRLTTVGAAYHAARVRTRRKIRAAWYAGHICPACGEGSTVLIVIPALSRNPFSPLSLALRPDVLAPGRGRYGRPIYIRLIRSGSGRGAPTSESESNAKTKAKIIKWIPAQGRNDGGFPASRDFSNSPSRVASRRGRIPCGPRPGGEKSGSHGMSDIYVRPAIPF